MTLESRWRGVLNEIEGTRAKLLVVSKTHPADEIRTLYQLGQRDFGENRVQELEEKAQQLADLRELRWHLIGHLQSNKIPKLNKIPNLVAIHSVDDRALAEKLLKGLVRPIDLFLQVNTSHEVEKSGFEDFDQLASVVELVKPRGLMTMGTLRTDDQTGEARRCFQLLRHWRDRLDPRLELSMGMSGDYPIAVAEGADWVRVGSKIFVA